MTSKEELLETIFEIYMHHLTKEVQKNLFDPNWKGWCEKCDGLHRTENCREYIQI